jgi:hypothetical protein
LLANEDAGIAAVAAPAGVDLKGFKGVRLPLDDVEIVADFVLRG